MQKILPSPLAHPPSAPRTPNRRTARFYDFALGLYPVVDCFCSAGRRRLIEQINQEPPGHLLEIGVGPGRHLRQYRNHQITAVDCSAKMVASSRGHCPAADLRQMDGERLDFPAESFDCVVICHVLSVTADPAKMLAEVHRVLRPGGRLFILNHETPRNAWRHVEALLTPLARRLCFRSFFRLHDIPGIEHFRHPRPLHLGGGFGLMKAWSFEK